MQGLLGPVCALLLAGLAAGAQAEPDLRAWPGAATVPRTGVAGTRVAGTGVTYRPPVTPMRVLRGFEPPSSPYGPGHRGVDLALGQGGIVAGAADGVVTFAGRVAGRGVVVIVHADGISTEYEPVTPVVGAGARVRRGEPVGRLSGLHAACIPASCLHWGARRGSAYVDPLSLLRLLAPVRLLPWPR